jgi:hypothetical protein
MLALIYLTKFRLMFLHSHFVQQARVQHHNFTSFENHLLASRFRVSIQPIFSQENYPYAFILPQRNSRQLNCNKFKSICIFF